MEPTHDTIGAPPEQKIDAAWFAERLPRPAELEEILGGDAVAALLGIAKNRAPVDTGLVTPAETDPEVRRQFAIATAAAAKLKRTPYPALTPEEVQALHLFVHLAARPSVLVQGGEVPWTPPPWPELDPARNGQPIAARLRGVGRIDTPARQPAGTGWFVAPDLLMTNNHVVAVLCGIDVRSAAWRTELDRRWAQASASWEADAAARPVWDPAESPATPPPGRVRRVRALHPHLDMAILEVEGVAGSAGLVLPLSARGPSRQDGELVYVAGYPAVGWGGASTAVLDLLFGGSAQNVKKRVAPGQLRGLSETSVLHDASTLGGSSGSPVLDFDTHKVVALHFRGVYGTANYAVALWKAQDDPLFAHAGITFG